MLLHCLDKATANTSVSERTADTRWNHTRVAPQRPKSAERAEQTLTMLHSSECRVLSADYANKRVAE